MEETPPNGIDPADWWRLAYRIARLRAPRTELQVDEMASTCLLELVRLSRTWDANHKSNARFLTYAWKSLNGVVSSYKEDEYKFRHPSVVRRETRYQKGERWQAKLHLFSECGRAFVVGEHHTFATVEPADSDDALSRDAAPVVIMDAMKSLDNRARGMIEMRFGLNGETESTLEEIGRRYYITKERVRQSIARAMRKIRDTTERARAMASLGPVGLTR